MITSRSALTALPGTHRLVLGVLTSTAAVGLLGTITGRAELTSDGTDGATAEQLAELCGRLPLALRIAGARLAARPHWTVDRLVSRLVAEHDRLDELTHGALSVRASLALGYSGLTEPGRTLFRRLGLVETPDFAGWVAAALLDAEPRDAEDVLEGLMEAQLVEYAGLDGIGEPRYRIHDLVRLHARERGETDEPPASVGAALTRLTGGYLALAEQAHRRQYGGDYTVLHGEGPRWDCGAAASHRLLADPAAWLRSERLGLVAAVDQAARLELSETCWDLAMTAITLFEAQGHFDDWRHTSETALAAVRRAGDPRGEAAMRYSLGTLDLFRQRYTAARPHFDAALPLFEAVNDQHGQALTLRNAALIERVEGRAGTALRRYRRALRMLREVGDRHAEAHVLGSIAQIHIEHGRADAAPLLETALAVYHDLGDLRGAAQILNRMGALHLRQGRTEQAGAAYRQVSAASQAIGDRIGEAYGLLGMGEAELLRGNSTPRPTTSTPRWRWPRDSGKPSSPPAPGWPADGSPPSAASTNWPGPCWTGRSASSPRSACRSGTSGRWMPGAPSTPRCPRPCRTDPDLPRGAARPKRGPRLPPDRLHDAGSPGSLGVSLGGIPRNPLFGGDLGRLPILLGIPRDRPLGKSWESAFRGQQGHHHDKDR